MIKLKRLLTLQRAFAIASLIYLVWSAIRLQVVGEALSAAALVPSILLFIAYSFSLRLPGYGRIVWYRVCMGLAIVFFGGGGVYGNIIRYLETGLAEYASFEAWIIAVAINSFGTLWNILAVLGVYKLDDEKKVK